MPFARPKISWCPGAGISSSSLTRFRGWKYKESRYPNVNDAVGKQKVMRHEQRWSGNRVLPRDPFSMYVLKFRKSQNFLKWKYFEFDTICFEKTIKGNVYTNIISLDKTKNKEFLLCRVYSKNLNHTCILSQSISLLYKI